MLAIASGQFDSVRSALQASAKALRGKSVYRSDSVCSLEPSAAVPGGTDNTTTTITHYAQAPYKHAIRSRENFRKIIYPVARVLH